MWPVERCGALDQHKANWDSAYCLGWIDGFHAHEVITNEMPLNCAPSGVTDFQLTKIFLKYAETHLEQLHEKAETVYALALIQAFPCRAEKAKNRDD